jgi:hypothetical protein
MVGLLSAYTHKEAVKQPAASHLLIGISISNDQEFFIYQFFTLYTANEWFLKVCC